ncbi:MAG: hypothetical protein ACPGSC_09025, partial [Granulosicoccaceae bacterium]
HKPRRSRGGRNRNNRDGRKPRQDRDNQSKQQQGSGQNAKPAAAKQESAGLFGKLKSAAKKIFGG